MARKPFVLAMLVGGLVLGLSSPVGAGGDATFEYSPTSGPPGTVIQASGDDCGLTVLNEAVVVLSTPGEDGSVIESVTIPVMNDTTWSGTLTVPEGTPPGDYDLQAFCTNKVQGGGVGSQAVDPPSNVEFTYLPNPGPFTVTGTPSPQGVPPDPPTNVTASIGSVIVSWTPPGNPGSSPITSYIVTASTGETYTVAGNATTITITDLGPGTYTFTVRAVNAAGSSISSAPSNSVTVTDPAQPVQATPRFTG